MSVWARIRSRRKLGTNWLEGGCPRVETKRIRGDSDLLSILRNERGSKAWLAQLDPVDQVTALWTNKTGPHDELGDKRGQRLWMSEGLMLLQLDPLDHHFDPEGQAPTLWTSTSWSTGSEGRRKVHYGLGCLIRCGLTAIASRFNIRDSKQ
jgi:hypothetical protein